jgi:hypothetical protein
MEVSMKAMPVRACRPAQIDLFDAATQPAPPLANLQLRHDELIELLSQLLWQVSRQLPGQPEVRDEQDQP